jgi:hypothetical protein
MCGEAARLLTAYNSALLDASTAAKKLADLARSSCADNFILLCNEKIRANARVKKQRTNVTSPTTAVGCDQPSRVR